MCVPVGQKHPFSGSGFSTRDRGQYKRQKTQPDHTGGKNNEPLSTDFVFK